MLIKLLPAHPHSTVLFSFTFGDIHPPLNNPPSWCSQIAQLLRDDLELPKQIHALDRSVGLIELLTQVTFDLPARTVNCQFVDGSEEVWVVGGTTEGNTVMEKWVKKLEDVLDDVYEATVEDEKERERERERDKVERAQRKLAMAAAVSMPGAVNPPTKPTRNHKRQRSLFMTVVSSLGSMITLNRTSSGLPTPPPTPFAPAHAQVSTLPPSSRNACPRFLRRRARSALVDTFRIYVLSELSRRTGFTSRLPHSSSYSISSGTGAYYAWVVQSMFRRATSRMDEIVHLAAAHGARGGVPPSPTSHYSYGACQDLKQLDPEKEKEEFCPTTMNVPSLFSDDEGDDTDTCSDWSSVHTPTSSCSTSQLSRLPSTTSTLSSLASSSPETAHLTSLLSSLSPYLTPHLLSEFEALSHARRRLYHLLVACHGAASHAALEERARLDILEIRSRRRAWSNKSLHGAGMRELGLAVPVRSSRLAQYSWGPDDLDGDKAIKVRWEESIVIEGDEYYSDIKGEIFGGRKRRRSIGMAKLFPVSEIEEDGDNKGSALGNNGNNDNNDDENLLQIEMGLDLEGGACRIGTDDEEAGLPIALEVERPVHRPRMRTASMHERRRLHHRKQYPQRVTVSFPPSPDPLPSVSKTSLLPSSALLCQPVSFSNPSSPLLSPSAITSPDEKPPMYTEVAFGVTPYTKEIDEFTLSMDVPAQMGVQMQSHGRKGTVRVHEVDVEAGYNVC